MSAQNNTQFINHLILLFICAAIPIGLLGFMNGAINWTGIVVIAVVIAALLVYRGRLNTKTK
jgi:hypothetical protein